MAVVNQLSPYGAGGGCSAGKKVHMDSCMFVEDDQRVRRVCLLANNRFHMHGQSSSAMHHSVVILIKDDRTKIEENHQIIGVVSRKLIWLNLLLFKISSDVLKIQ